MLLFAKTSVTNPVVTLFQKLFVLAPTRVLWVLCIVRLHRPLVYAAACTPPLANTVSVWWSFRWLQFFLSLRENVFCRRTSEKHMFMFC